MCGVQCPILDPDFRVRMIAIFDALFLDEYAGNVPIFKPPHTSPLLSLRLNGRPPFSLLPCPASRPTPPSIWCAYFPFTHLPSTLEFPFHCCAGLLLFFESVARWSLSRLVEKTDCEIVYSRSGGAGGQNVNKVNTKVDLRLDLSKAPFLSPETVEAIRRREGNRVTKEGLLVVKSEVHRTQYQNLDDALDRMNDIILAAATSLIVSQPTAEKKARIRGLSRQYERKRIDEKKAVARKKSNRKSSRGFDDY